MLSPLVALPLLPLVLAGSSATYSLSNLPHTSEAGQTGYNDCGSTDSQSSMCQTVQVNSVTDFCLWAPPTAGPEIGESEEYEVAWCTATGHGARVMPAGTIQSAHYLETPHYIQITGTGDFTKINVKAGDQGGELDPHGATGLGNPIGSLVFANGVQMHEWHSFISDTEYCIRVCKDSDDAWLWCQHIYDTMGKAAFMYPQPCEWVDPGNYGSGFDSCEGAGTVNPPGIYTGSDGKRSTFNQGDGHTPTAMAPGASSNCQAVATVGGAGAAVAAPASSSAAASSVSSAVSSASSAVSTGESSASSAVSSGMSTSVLSSASSGLSSSASVSASNPSSSVVTVTSTSSASSATLPVTTAGQQAAASASNKPSSGASSLAVSAVGSLVAVAGAIAFFA